MKWDYAELSKMAKSVGGPEKLADFLIDSGKKIGHKEMLPLIGIAVGIGALGYAGISKFVNDIRRKKEISREEVETVRKELIQGIKEYDDEHSDVDDLSTNVQEDEINK